MPLLKQWAEAGSSSNTSIWVQLNHPGKQSPMFLSPEPVAPSAIPLSGDLKAAFKIPRALTHEEILLIIDRFATSAEIVKEAGFGGVQIHAAHGYLVSQFLSPRHNQRTDNWGGSLENRMAFILSIYRAIRKKVGKNYPIGIKLNSSDFQKDGFSEADSMAVISALSEEGIDLIEISGGSYEKPAMMGSRSSTSKREAYFADFCSQVHLHTKTPIMLTGGFRSAVTMEDALEKNICDMIGLARPLTLDPELPKKILGGDMKYHSSVKELTTGWNFLDRMGMLNITWYEQQIALIGHKKNPNPRLNPFLSLLKTFSQIGLAAFKKRRT